MKITIYLKQIKQANAQHAHPHPKGHREPKPDAAQQAARKRSLQRIVFGLNHPVIAPQDRDKVEEFFNQFAAGHAVKRITFDAV